MSPSEYYKFFFEDVEDIRKKSIKLIKKFPIETETEVIKQAFSDTKKLFRGDFPGYQASNTKYHDFAHTASVYFAMIRLLDGALLEGTSVSARGVTLGILAALFHDSGLIMKEDDSGGTGAKYTVGHEDRSIAFAHQYLELINMDKDEKDSIEAIINYTRMRSSESTPAEDPETALLGKCLGTADIMAQMSDRFYLEKLFCLYEEFQEAGIPGYESEYDLLAKTKSFFENIVVKRLKNELGNVRVYFKTHFSKRFGIKKDLYFQYIKQNIEYLSRVLDKKEAAYHNYFKRNVSCPN
jgi:hypothetical protein